YRSSDSSYASGKNFLEVNDVDDTTLNGVSTTWTNGTSDTVWTVDTANQKVIIDKTAIAAANLYKSGATNEVTFSAGTTIIEVRREVQDQSSPAVDFSNASILTEQDLDNSSSNVFHMAQQAIVASEKALLFNSGSGVYEAYQPGTTTRRKITQVADGVADNDATNVGQFNTHDAAIEAQKVATLGYQEDTEDYKLETADWATKVNGVVNTYTDNVAQTDGSEYSAKAYSVGGTGVTGGSNRGSARDWAIGAGGTMASKPDGSEYSAKEYAQGSTATGGTSKQWSLGGGSHAVGTAVAGTDYSAKAYAQLEAAGTSTYGGSAKGWASTAYDTAVPGAGSSD
ncbi:MAG: phage tail fiber protein, partial [Anaerolineales bacterium]|nr:phage tail fiber protein [Anaerolineales bacterium]